MRESPASAPRLTVLAGHEAEVGFELMRVAEAMRVVDRSEEGRRGDGADAGDRAQARHAGILDGEVFDRHVRVRELLVKVTHDGEQRSVRTAGGHGVAVLTEESPDDRDVACARVDQGIPHPRRPRTMRWGSEKRWAGR